MKAGGEGSAYSLLWLIRNAGGGRLWTVKKLILCISNVACLEKKCICYVLKCRVLRKDMHLLCFPNLACLEKICVCYLLKMSRLGKALHLPIIP